MSRRQRSAWRGLGSFAALLLAALLLTPVSVAQVPVDTGETVEFTQGDGGGIECRIDAAVLACTDAAFTGTAFDAVGRSV